MSICAHPPKSYRHYVWTLCQTARTMLSHTVVRQNRELNQTKSSCMTKLFNKLDELPLLNLISLQQNIPRCHPLRGSSAVSLQHHEQPRARHSLPAFRIHPSCWISYWLKGPNNMTRGHGEQQLLPVSDVSYILTLTACEIGAKFSLFDS